MLREMADSRDESGKLQNKRDHLIMLENKEELKELK